MSHLLTQSKVLLFSWNFDISKAPRQLKAMEWTGGSFLEEKTPDGREVRHKKPQPHIPTETLPRAWWIGWDEDLNGFQRVSSLLQFSCFQNKRGTFAFVPFRSNGLSCSFSKLIKIFQSDHWWPRDLLWMSEWKFLLHYAKVYEIIGIKGCRSGHPG